MIYITDEIEKYNRSSQERKILYNPIGIKQDSFLSQEIRETINLNCLGLEYKAAEEMLIQLNSIVERQANVENAFLSSVKNSYSVYYPLLWKTVRRNSETNFFLQLLSSKLKCNPRDLDVEISYFKPNEVKSEFQKNLMPFSLKNSSKNALKSVFSTFNPKLTSNSKHNCVLFLYDVPSVVTVVEELFQLINKQADIHLHVILISMLENTNSEIKPINSKQISFYRSTEFKTPIPTKRRKIYAEISRKQPELERFIVNDPLAENEFNYQFIEQLFRKNKIDAAIYLGVLEIGRAINECASHYSIPSFNIDYGLFSDDPLYMENKISFTYKCCISQLSSDIWKKRKDTSLNHFITGFLKLDKAIALNPALTPKKRYAHTILFLSSWSGTSAANDVEKIEIIVQLIALATKNNWNLIVKLHPSEEEKIVADLLNNLDPKQFSYQKLGLVECIQAADFVLTQSSSALSEAVYFDKPIAYFLVNKESNLIDYLPIKSDTIQLLFHDFSELEKQIIQVLTNELDVKKKYSELREYVWKYTDQKSSTRFLDLLQQTIQA
jgi:CDP-glycerol glycerophosphotransferase (TagB/SpsB family)